MNSKTSQALLIPSNITTTGKTTLKSILPFHNLFQGAVLCGITRKMLCRTVFIWTDEAVTTLEEIHTEHF